MRFSARTRRVSAGAAWALLCCALTAGGCAGRATPATPTTSGALWSGLGVSLRLPPGTWDAAEGDDANTVTFTAPRRERSLALLRSRARANQPEWYPLRSLFVEFPEKTLRRRWDITLSDGTRLPCAEYEVALDGRTVTVRAGAARRGEWNYALAEWVFSGVSEFDGVAASLTLPAPDTEAGR